jgi:hypothetical protein
MNLSISSFNEEASLEEEELSVASPWKTSSKAISGPLAHKNCIEELDRSRSIT